MKLNSTLSRYLAKTYFKNFLVLFGALLAIIYLFDTVELIRRAADRDDVPLGLVLQMGLLKLPEVGQQLFPFGILFSAMFTFWQLTKRLELVVVRAAGFSVWQFLTPIIFMAALIGIVQMTVVNPLGAMLVSRFEQLESRYINAEDDDIAIFKEGLWLRQNTSLNTDISVSGKADIKKSGYVILHAKRIEPPWILKNITVFYFDNNDNFIKRMNADSAALEVGRWVFKDTKSYSKNNNIAEKKTITLKTHLTIKDVEESFSSPRTLSFWRLPGHIKTLEDTGFDARRLRVYYQNLLAQPLLFIAMILLAASFSMRPPRSRGAFAFIAAGIFIGFFVFFMSSFLQALGTSQQIPVILAAWSPALISMLLGLSVVMVLEDG